jgi:hypothetical protein
LALALSKATAVGVAEAVEAMVAANSLHVARKLQVGWGKG